MRIVDVDLLDEILEDSCDNPIKSQHFVEFWAYIDELPTIDDIILFPCTIGDIKFTTKEELVKYIHQRNSEIPKNCLSCSNSFSEDDSDGNNILICFSCKGYEGKMIIPNEDGYCENYN